MLDAAKASGDVAADGSIINKGAQIATHGGVNIGGGVVGNITTGGSAPGT